MDVLGEMGGDGMGGDISQLIIWRAKKWLTGCSGLKDCLDEASKDYEVEVICAAFFLGRKLGPVEAKEQFKFNTVTDAKSIRG